MNGKIMMVSSECLMENEVSLPISATKLIIDFLKYVLRIHGATCAMKIISKADPVDDYFTPIRYLL